MFRGRSTSTCGSSNRTWKAEAVRILIIGGGIGGLTAAIALRRVGHDVQVFERAPEPREVGAGIGLWGNAVGALRRINLADAVLARGEAMRIAAVLTWRGRVLHRSTADVFNRIGGEPLALVHRAELLEELLRPLPPESVHFGRTIVKYEDDGAGVTAHFDDGSHETGDLLIGADGLKSAVRAQLLGKSAPRYSGYTAWRAVVPFPESRIEPGYVAEIWGPAARFGITRIGRGRVYWWATLTAPESPLEQGALDAAAKEILLRSHGGFCDPVPDLIRAADAGSIIRNDIYDRPPVRTWHKGRVLLIGDAAHPTTPNLGQGGCLAVEDGVCLGYFLRGGSPANLEPRLRDFVRFRYTKTATVVRQSRNFGALGQWRNPVLRWGRDRVMSIVAEPGFRLSARKIGRFEAPTRQEGPE
jgi:2-polyprenyl-6-methoxyphenol hydroxylase-like FAD-dependent oxidoreductase